MTTDLDTLLGSHYLDDLPARPIEEIRAMRAECVEVETALSYVRRLAHGRLDILAAERARRRGGEPSVDLAAMVEQLPEILGDRDRGPSSGRLPQTLEPVDGGGAFADELHALVSPNALADLGGLDEAALEALCDGVVELERRVSEQRHDLHRNIDILQAELTRRYRTGEASVDTLLQ